MLNQFSMLENLRKFKIILGSASPRRLELMKGIDLEFEVRVMDVEENYPANLTGVGIPMFLAEKKARAFDAVIEDDHMIITADTVVILEGNIMGKPYNKEAAIRMLQKLSGKTHQVVTGVCIATKERRKTFYVASEVRFTTLTHDEISYYVDKYKPYDKAGSYGIQEWIGYIGVEHITGSYFNVMGLPIQRLYRELKRWL